MLVCWLLLLNHQIIHELGLEALTIIDVLAPARIEYYLQLLHSFLESVKRFHIRPLQ